MSVDTLAPDECRSKPETPSPVVDENPGPSWPAKNAAVVDLRAVAERALAGLFIGAITLPLIGLTYREVRRLTSGGAASQIAMPRLQPDWESIRRYPAAFREYFGREFGFRDDLILFHANYKVRSLGISSTHRVVLGKSGWLFYNDKDTTDDYRGLKPFTPDELRQWQELLERRRDWLKAQGIDYVFVVAPNKQQIYPQYLPRELQQRRPGTRYDQLVEHLEQHSDFRILDLRPSLRAASQKEQVYFKTDHHWNPIGAFIAYQQLMGQVRQTLPKVKIPERSDFQEVAAKGEGDLSKIMGFVGVSSEQYTKLVPRTPRKARYTVGQDVDYPQDLVVMESPAGEARRAVVMRDSFTRGYLPHLSEHFNRIAYRWTYGGFDTALIKREKPDIVIQEMVEHGFLLPIPAWDEAGLNWRRD